MGKFTPSLAASQRKLLDSNKISTYDISREGTAYRGVEEVAMNIESRIRELLTRMWAKVLEFRESERGKKAAGRFSDLKESDSGKKAASTFHNMRQSGTGRRAESTINDLRHREPVRKAEESTRKFLHDIHAGATSGGGGESGSPPAS